MGRWIKNAAIFLVTVAFIIVGVGIALFLIENDRWERVDLHPWLRQIGLGDAEWEVWVPLLVAGWFVATLILGILFLWSVFYVWRRRRYESEIRRLQRELIKLRNLPFEDPAPFEDVVEMPDPTAASLMLRLGRATGDDATGDQVRLDGDARATDARLDGGVSTATASASGGKG